MGAMPELILRTNGDCQLDLEHLLETFDDQRQRFAGALKGFGPEDWAAPSRCSAWSAHEVVRHVCDIATIGMTLGPDDTTFDFAAGFEPRTSPDKWMATSAEETPDATMDRYTAMTGELLALARSRLAEGRSYDILLPYGPMDWTVLWLHGFWDSWIHERDVLLARGAEHPTDDDATAYAAVYGIFIAAATASMFGVPVQETLTLGGEGGGIVEVDSTDGVTVTVHRAPAAAGTHAAGTHAAGTHAAEVADTLAGRGSTADRPLGDVSADSRAALLVMADYFRTPV
jgi:uncharacterized protein (TIGR03083 family)